MEAKCCAGGENFVPYNEFYIIRGYFEKKKLHWKISLDKETVKFNIFGKVAGSDYLL